MKRIFLAALGASLLAALAPSVASAHHSKHHAACGASAHKHHAKCARVHVLSFGATTTSSGSATTSPTTPSTETAGTITAFTSPLLTITLNDKTEVSGKVTEKTEVECVSATPTTGEDDQDAGEDNGSTGDGGSTSDGGDAKAVASDTQQSGSDDQGEEEGSTENCTAALKVGAMVRSAELRVGNEGAVWEKLVLVS
jgi:hypothetical protein